MGTDEDLNSPPPTDTPRLQLHMDHLPPEVVQNLDELLFSTTKDK